MSVLFGTLRCNNSVRTHKISVIRVFVWGGGELEGGVDSKKLLEPCSGEKNFFRPSSGFRGMLPQKILKI